MKVKVCPKCGRQFENHCWHETMGNEVPTVEMEATEALKLISSTIMAAEQELDRLRFDRDNYMRMVT